MPKNANQSKFSNYSMDFDGSSYIDVGNANELNITESITISAWVKASSSSTDRCYVSKRGTSGNAYQISQYTNKAIGLSIWIGGGNRKDLLGTTNHVQDVWYHVVGTYDGSYMRVYVNGVEENNQAQTGSIDTTTNSFRIAADNYSSTYWFNGQITEVSIFDYALSSSQVTTLWGGGTSVSSPMALPRTPIAYYPLGTSAWDGNFLAENNAIGDYVFSFNGSNNYIQTSSHPIDFTTGNFTCSAWIKPIAQNSHNVIFALRDNTDTELYYFIRSSGSSNANKFESYNGTNAVLSTSTATFGAWSHVTLVQNGANKEFYINGVLDNTAAQSNGASATSANFIIGSGTESGNGSFNGEISNAQIFNTALSSTDVESLYNNGTPLTSMSGYSSLQGWWKLDNTTTGIQDSAGSNNGTNNGATEYAGFVNTLAGESSGMSQSNLVQSDLQTVAPYSKYAMSFDGINDYINCGNDSSLNFNSSFSVSVWIKGWSGTTDKTVVSKSDGNTFGWSLHAPMAPTYANKFIFWLNTNVNWYSVENSNNYSDNTKWVNLIAVFNNSANSLILYSNTVSSTTTTTSGSPTISSVKNFLIGTGGSGSNRYYTGSMSNLSVWNTALTASQVREIYNEGLPSNLNSHSAYSNLVSWWQLGENSSFTNNWICADEKASNNGESQNMGVDALTNGVGTTANGVSNGMSVEDLVGDAPYSTANAISSGMAVTAKGSDVP